MNANNRSPGPKNGNDGGGSGGGGQARLPGIGGLFGEGFPTLKPAGTNRVPGNVDYFSCQSKSNSLFLTVNQQKFWRNIYLRFCFLYEEVFICFEI